MTSDVKDVAIDRVIDAISKVDAWNNVDCITDFSDFCLKYDRSVRTISNLKKIRGPADFMHHHDIVDAMLENKRALRISNGVVEACKQYESRRFTDREEDKHHHLIVEMYSFMAIRAIQHVDGAYQYLDKSVEELQLLSEGGDDAATNMLTVVKVLNWKSE
jgi:hypothetical protein